MFENTKKADMILTFVSSNHRMLGASLVFMVFCFGLWWGGPSSKITSTFQPETVQAAALSSEAIKAVALSSESLSTVIRTQKNGASTKGQTQKEKLCAFLYKCVIPRGFYLVRVQTWGYPFVSIERKVVESLRPVISGLTNPKKNNEFYVIDVGVNDGEDISMWKDVFDSEKRKTRFLLFEPQLKYQNTIRSIIASSGKSFQERTTLYQAAIGSESDHNTTVLFYGEGVKASTNNATKNAGGTGPRVQKVLLLNLMKLLPPVGHIVFMKIDCEGADFGILMSTRTLFEQRRVDIVVFELNHKYRNFKVAPSDVFRMLESFNYSLYMAGVDPDKTIFPYFHHNALMLLKFSAAQLALWDPNLETIVVVREGIDLFKEGALQKVPMNFTLAYLRSLDRGNALTKNKYNLLRKRCASAAKNSNLVLDCFQGLFVAKCPICGGETVKSRHVQTKEGGNVHDMLSLLREME